MKKFLAVILSLTIFSQTAYGLTDDRIMTDPPANIYSGRPEAAAMITNLSFTDVAADHWAKERITRSGAFNMVKGDNGRFLPDGQVTNQEAIAFVVRVMGLENEAHNRAAELQAVLPADSTLKNLWSLGYLQVAYENGLIDLLQYDDALVEDQTTLDPETQFHRGRGATREQVAQWLYQALLILDSSVFETTASRQAIFTFSDYEDISANKVAAVDALASKGIMRGSDGRFNPKATLTRAEMATLLANMDQVYLAIAGLEKKTGTVGGIADGQYNATGTAGLGRQFYIRAADGTIDILQYTVVSDPSPQTGTLDAVVYKNNTVEGLLALSEADQIEYIVNPLTSEVYYVQVHNTRLVERTVRGILQTISEGTVTIRDSSGKTYTYPLADGIVSDGQAYLSGRYRDIASLPYGSSISLRLKNDVVDVMTYIGEPSVFTEMRGIVIENNPEFGYITFVDNNGSEVTKHYISGDLRVEKQPYYMSEDTAGYLSHVFPSFVYNPRTAQASDVEPGDIIFIRIDPNDPDNIIWMSASTNYMMRYGKIRTFTVEGDTAGLLVEYENGQTAWFDLAADIPITKSGRIITPGNVMVGDWARFLINQAIVAPGVVIESVKEITIEGGDGHLISNIVKGQLAGINTIQNQIILQNVQTLEKSGWADYQNLSQFSIAGNDIEFYRNNERVSLDYLNQYLKRSEGEVYVALENNFTGEKVRRVTFRDGRDELLPADTVVNTTGSGGFMITGASGTISTDEGTIVRRHGRLVQGGDIIAPDYAVVALNGYNTAAVVDIKESPGTSGVTIVRGRVLSVDGGRSFKVQSMSTLVGDGWAYTPVQREFTIDNQTLFIGESGLTSIDDFISYGDDSVADRVFNIVVDGSRAARVIDVPYATASIRGSIYEVSDASISLKDVEYLENSSGRWRAISLQNPVLTVNTASNTIIAKENQVITAAGLEIGDYIRVMMVAPAAAPAPGDSIDGLIVRVDK